MVIVKKAGSPTSQTFWLHDEARTGGAAVLYVNGVAYPVTLTSAFDFSAAVEVTGLDAGTHSYYGTLGAAVTKMRTFRTQPAAGQPVKLLFSSDFGGVPWPAYRHVIDNESDADAFFASEWQYLDAGEYQTAPCSAETISAIPNPLAVNTFDADYDRFVECYRRKYNCLYHPGQLDHHLKSECAQTFRMRMTPSNHEFMTLTPGPVSAPGEKRFDAFAKVCHEYYYLGQPINTDPDLDTVPSPGPFYWRETIGDIEIIVTDPVCYNDDSLGFKLNGAALSRGQDKQLAWAKAAIANSTARVIVLFLGTSIPNNTEWTGAGNLFDTIDAKAKTIIAISGNQHRPFARLLNTGLPTRPLLELGANPFCQVNNSDIYHYAGETLYFQEANATLIADVYANLNGGANAVWSYASLEWLPNGDHEDANPHVKVKFKNSITGRVKWKCIIREGERTPRFTSTRAVAP